MIYYVQILKALLNIKNKVQFFDENLIGFLIF